MEMARKLIQISLSISLLIAAALPQPVVANDVIDCSVTVRKSSEAACSRIIARPASSEAERFMAYYNRAWYHRRAGAPSQALNDFDAAGKLNRDFAKLYLSRASVKRQLNDLDGALSDLEIYTVLEPGGWSGYYERADVLRQLGKPSKALAALEKALEMKPYERALKPLRILLLSDLGRQAEAVIEADRLVAVRRSDAEGRYARAVVSFRRGSLDKALSDLKRALKQRALFPAASALLGQILELRGEYEEAKAQYRLALKSAGPTIDRETAQDLARRRLDALESGPAGRVALRTRSDSPFSRSAQKAGSGGSKGTDDCRRYIPSAAVTVSVPCGD